MLHIKSKAFIGDSSSMISSLSSIAELLYIYYSLSKDAFGLLCHLVVCVFGHFIAGSLQVCNLARHR